MLVFTLVIVSHLITGVSNVARVGSPAVSQSGAIQIPVNQIPAAPQSNQVAGMSYQAVGNIGSVAGGVGNQGATISQVVIAMV